MTAATSSEPPPISVSTSQACCGFRDNDGAGSWSTFIVEVGTPAQPARVMVSTAGNEIWVVVPQGCPDKYGSDCAKNRGGIFTVENSTTWTNIGLYTLELETNLGYTGNGQYGHETVSLGYPGSGGPSLDNQNVAGIAAPDYWQGVFGLDATPSNFTTLNEPQASYLATLRNQSRIPSTSWGYTAGAAYRYGKVQGSLTLGGYDASRFSSQNVTLPFYDDVARRFLVQVSAIKYIPTGLSTTTTSTTLASDPISLYIDSTVPYIYLPDAICEKFESAFGLKWNDTTEIYTLNDTMHTALQTMNPNITFTFSTSNGQHLDITLPYKAFDLNASFPVIPDGTINYFPLKRAANDTQYTLGRTFLQEAYLMADYDRSEFTIAPCVWPSTFKSDIMPILPPSADNTKTNVTLTGTQKHSNTPVGAIVGGVVAGVSLMVGATLLFYFFIYRRRHMTSDSSPDPTTGPSAYAAVGQGDPSQVDPTKDKSELYGHCNDTELDSAHEREKRNAELAGKPILGSELPSSQPVGSELESPQIFEMPAREPVAKEMESSLGPGQNPKTGEENCNYLDKDKKTRFSFEG
ncbi:Candidapepsin-8 [Lachnellula cervina]|uniref:Candidapepsin-8 n=1 Tax=Lachnellula cervina TaxID=1316786 RepID=A0A7D8UML2_9HELO|nr:Candidapepsin-8 [Lachnellula cervina]